MPDLSIPQGLTARRRWIRGQLLIRNLPLAAVAARLGVSRQAVHTALFKPYPRMEREIARLLGIEPQALWPERYGPDGKPNRKTGPKPVNKNSTTSRSRRNGKRPSLSSQEAA